MLPVATATRYLVFSDASWKTGVSYAGFFLMYNNAAIDWQSTLIKVVMLSSAEAEIASASLASRRVIYTLRFLCKFDPSLKCYPVSHIVDNSALPPLTENVGASRKTEHFRRWEQFMQYMVTHGWSFVHLCKTYDMYANTLTKVETASAFHKFKRFAMNL